MPKVGGIFSSFDNLDEIETEDIAKWLKNPASSKFYLENYFANKLLYPQVAPTTPQDLNYDLAILREVLKKNLIFYNIKQKKFLIPELFSKSLPDLVKLVWAFIDAYCPNDLVTINLIGESSEKILGSVVIVKFENSSPVTLNIENKVYQIKPGTLMIIPCPGNRCHIQITGKNEAVFETAGGKLGLFIDGRFR